MNPQDPNPAPSPAPTPAPTSSFAPPAQQPAPQPAPAHNPAPVEPNYSAQLQALTSERDTAASERDTHQAELHSYKVREQFQNLAKDPNQGIRDGIVVGALINAKAIQIAKDAKTGAQTVTGFKEEIERIKTQFPHLFLDTNGSADGAAVYNGEVPFDGNAWLRSALKNGK